MFPKLPTTLLAALLLTGPLLAQQVTLPLPRLLTLMPMGGQAGHQVEITVTGENIEEVTELHFSHPSITAAPVKGKAKTFAVTISKDTPAGVYDARVVSRLGISSARAFAVGDLAEVTRTKANNSLETAMPLQVGSVCNATMTKRAVDYYSFKGTQGEQLAIECSAAGIDSRLSPVLVVADAKGADLKVNRTGGMIDFTPAEDGTYLIKVNDLTYQGGERHFYRLALQKGPASPLPQTQQVSAMSWPPAGFAAKAASTEVEPNNKDAQQITLPCDIAGSFFPAADVDTYEFTAKKGETWWVEVASERLGLNTDPFVLVQQVKDGKFTDVAEFYDIAPPMKVTSNGYSYDGPPYDAGSPDVMGQFTAKEDGVYRLQVRDLFGGTRNVPQNVYRLVVRRASPDFSLAAWAVHMTLRNGDRAALSKPAALRQGDVRVFEVVTQRRDGFDGDIEISMENLPPGVKATGLKIAKGKTYGHLVIYAEDNAPKGHALARVIGTAKINGKEVSRPVRFASMKWPVKDAKGEIPSPRLMANIPVSVTDSEQAPLTIAAAEDRLFEAKVGESVTIPLAVTWRSAFNGTSIKVKAYGSGLSAMKEFEIPIKAATHNLTLNLAELKLEPGDYTFALQSLGICKYSYNPGAVPQAEAEQKKAAEVLASAAAEAKAIAATDAAAAKKAAEKQKQAEAAMTAATSKMKSVTAAANPADTVEILISRPVRLRVTPAAVPATASK